MAKTATELLQGILTVISRIEQRMDKKEPSGGSGASMGIGVGVKAAMNVAANLAFFGKVKDKTKKSFIDFMKDISDIVKNDKGKNFEYFSDGMIKISDALPNLVKNLTELGKMRASNVARGLNVLKSLYEFMHEMGDSGSARRVERATKLFAEMGKSLDTIAKPLKSMSTFLIYLAVGIVAFAGALLLTSVILGLTSPKDAILFVLFTIGTLVLAFGMLAMTRAVVKTGTNVIRDIGFGMAALAIGIVTFALGLKLLPMILGGETNGSIVKSLLLMTGIVLATVLMFSIIGLAAPLIDKGVKVVFWMSLGMVAIAASMIVMAMAAKYMAGGTLAGDKLSASEKDENKKYILKGLGTIGLVLLAATATFVLLGLTSEFIVPGILVSLLMSVALIVLAKSLIVLSKTAKELQGNNLGEQISFLVGGTITGLLDGFAPLTGGKKGVGAAIEFIKNSAKIFAGIGVLMAMSLALSMFAKAISVFADLGNMRVIEGYDKDGRPIFGERINIQQVANNINYSISTFLTSLISSTDGLEKSQAKAIKKMAKALTGKRGLLTAVIQFADALKVYAQFGANNEIGYVEYDENGKETYKKVAAKTVVDNIIGSFLYFSNRMFDKSDEEFGDGEEAGISGRQKRRMKRMSKALVGRNGILGAVVQFADVLKVFAEFGKNNELPIIGEDGKPTGKTLKIQDIADNIVKALTTFSDTLATKLESASVKDAGKALEKYEDMIEQLNKLSTSMDGLVKITNTIQQLADGIGTLGVNIDKLNTDKLSQIIDKSNAANSRMVFANMTTTQTAGGSGGGSTTGGGSQYTQPKEEQIDWERISQMIGERVGEYVSSSFKGGHYLFEFDTTKTGGVLYWDTK